ncbi:swi2 snf2-containing protein rad54 [Cystoisospora suis]|uniref:Swi2 snf2-containing protein rad54 n=1 Tax=Cystoisospora suis TaxID=483139 RepID=A0A2C6KL18_9APIC|nr:swi2 snf2-containing protein rad54 [Cystoisospora suis]
MKLCNHPSLVKSQAQMVQGFEKCEKYFTDLDLEGQKARQRSIRPEISGKLLLLSRLLDVIRTTTSDKIVLISNYTQTLDLFERMCRDRGYPVVRLDGQTSIKKRHAMITKFNDPSNPQGFVFLLSSKAGGCGVNLIGANRLVLFDPDWNPANDKQALARVWRDGQKKTCFIYRFFSTGTIEEKIYQRQICKDGLSAMLVSEGENQIKDCLSTELVKDLFRLKLETLCDTHDMIECERCFVNPEDAKAMKAKLDDELHHHSTPTSHDDETENIDGNSLERRDGEATTTETRSSHGPKKLKPFVPQLDLDFDEDDLLTWAHHSDIETIPDPCLRQAALACIDNFPPSNNQNHHMDGEELEGCPTQQPISFVMSCRIEFKHADEKTSPADTPSGTTSPTLHRPDEESNPGERKQSLEASGAVEKNGRPLSSGVSVEGRPPKKKKKLTGHGGDSEDDGDEDDDFVVCIDSGSSDED